MNRKEKKWFLLGGVASALALALFSVSLWDEIKGTLRLEEGKEHSLPGEINKRALSRLPGWVAYQSNEDGDWEIWVMRFNGKRKRKLTDNSAEDFYPRWSYDGKWIAFVSDRDGNNNIYRMNVETRKLEQLTDHESDEMDPDWSPDGKNLVFTSSRSGREELYLLDVKTKEVSSLTEGPGRNGLASFSPDGKKIAFSSNRLIGWSVYLMDVATRKVSKLISGHGACRPDWSADGEWISLVSQKADGKGDIYVIREDGSEFRRITTTSKVYDYFPSWGEGSRFVVFARTLHKKSGPWNLYVADLKKEEELRVTDAPYSTSFPDWSK